MENGDYITKEEVLNLLTPSDTRISDNYIKLVKEEIKLRPPADVVEVVRCKDCKYSSIADINDYEDEYRCELLRGHLFFSGDYCSYGERREQEHEVDRP